MAKLRTYDSLDMLDYSGDVGEIAYFDADVLVVETFDSVTYYFVDFTYPNGESWEGTIEAIQVYDYFGALLIDLRGIAASTKIASIEYPRERATKQIFQDDDAIFGSGFDDRLVGFSGDDKIMGKDG